MKYFANISQSTTNVEELFYKTWALTLICVGFLGIRFEVGSKITHCRKLVRILLEAWNLVRKYRHIFNFKKYTFQYQGSFNFADVSIF